MRGESGNRRHRRHQAEGGRLAVLQVDGLKYRRSGFGADFRGLSSIQVPRKCGDRLGQLIASGGINLLFDQLEQQRDRFAGGGIIHPRGESGDGPCQPRPCQGVGLLGERLDQ